MSDLFLRLVNGSINAGWLVLVILLLRLVLKRASKWVRPALWGLVGLRLLLPFSIESPWSLLPSAETVPLDIAQMGAPAIHSGLEAVNAAVNPVLLEQFQPDPVASANPLQVLLPVLALVWALGAAAMLGYAMISYLLLQRRVATAVRIRDNVYESERVETPFVLGLIHPRILLPMGLAPKDAEMIVAHEAAHIRRRDHWWKLLTFCLLAVYWFHPLLWLAYWLLGRDLELACDEAVVRDFNAAQRADYSQVLLRCSASHHHLAACPLAFGEVGVKQRVKAVLHYKKPAFWLLLAALLAGIVTAVCFLTNPPSPVPLEQWTPEAAEVWNVPAETGYALSVGELDELSGRLKSLRLGGVMDSYQGFTPLYTMTITAAGERITCSVFDTEGTHAGLLYDGVYYRIEDADFIAYLIATAQGQARTESVEVPQSGETALRTMTLDDVRALSEKGETLTWGDLEGFAYTETGSGLYIRIFEVEGGYTLSVGGGSPKAEEQPLYAYFSAGEAAYIDLRTGALEAFLAGEPPYLLSLSRPDVQVFDGPGYDYGFVNTITEPGVYTIVAEQSDGEGNRWGQLKSGLGWIDLARALAEPETRLAVTVSFADTSLIGTGAYQEFVEEESEFISYLLFTPLETVTEVTLSRTQYGDEESVLEALGAWPELSPEKPLMAGVVFYGDMTAYVLSFTDETGEAWQYEVSISGRNGALVWETYPG